MGVVQNILDFLRNLLSWWFVVLPWEQAIRVRFGKYTRLFGAGLYWRIPFFDVLYIQNVRRRISTVPVQTLGTSDGKTITLHGSLGYRVADVLKLQMTLHDAEGSVQQELLGLITKYVVSHAAEDCGSAQIIAAICKQLDLTKYGLADAEFFLTGYVADVPTFRMLQDYMGAYGVSSGLSTVSTQQNVPAGTTNVR